MAKTYEGDIFITMNRDILFVFLFILLVGIILFFVLQNEQKKTTTLLSEEKTILQELQFDNEVALLLKNESKNPIKRLTTINEYGNEPEDNKTKLEGISTAAPTADAKKIIEKLYSPLKKKGYIIFLSESNFGLQNSDDQIGVVKTNDQFKIIEMKETNGANYDINTDAVIAKLKAWDKLYNLKLTGADFDWFEVKLLNPPTNMKSLADEVYAFCPDVVDQGVGTVKKLEEELQQNKTIYCWWD